MALTDYVIMPGADYQALCDSIRAKIGTTDTIKSGDIPSLLTNTKSVVSVSTETEMDALLVSENVGNAYIFTGTTTDKYINGDIYMVEEATS